MTDEETRMERAIRRLLAADRARDELIPFTKFVMPTPDDPDDATRSLYSDAKHHRVLGAALEEIERGNYRRLIVNIPPRHGKTELASKKFIPWYAGRNPGHSVIFGTYNEKYAWDVGRKVRETLQSSAFSQVFPDFFLKDGSAAVDRLETMDGGVIAFVGRGGTITGRGGDILVIDDPLKDRREANSRTIRDQLWDWFTDVMGSRLMTKDARILLIQTRWHEDDLVGRLTDPRNPFYDEDEAKSWKLIDLPALAIGDDDPLGRKPGEALWPERFDVEFLENQRRMSPSGFSALYQGRPSPEGGAFFKDEWLKTYKPHELPTNLRKYIASDHAVSLAQDRDKTAIVPVGVDEQGDIWVLPDVFWAQADTGRVVEQMLKMIRTHKPLFWWAERGHITKSIGPFLRKRMMEEGVHCAIAEVIPLADKQTRAQSIQGRMSMGRIRFPERASWWPDARDQLLKFPQGAHDDFVDALSYIGLGISQLATARQVRQLAAIPKQRTFGQLLEQSNKQRYAERLARATGGW